MRTPESGQDKGKLSRKAKKGIAGVTLAAVSLLPAACSTQSGDITPRPDQSRTIEIPSNGQEREQLEFIGGKLKEAAEDSALMIIDAMSNPKSGTERETPWAYGNKRATIGADKVHTPGAEGDNQSPESHIGISGNTVTILATKSEPDPNDDGERLSSYIWMTFDVPEARVTEGIITLEGVRNMIESDDTQVRKIEVGDSYGFNEVSGQTSGNVERIRQEDGIYYSNGPSPLNVHEADNEADKLIGTLNNAHNALVRGYEGAGVYLSE